MERTLEIRNLLLIGRPETLIIDGPVSPCVVEFPVFGHMRGGADDELVLNEPVVESFRVEGGFVKRVWPVGRALRPSGVSSGECRARLLFWRSFSKSFSNSRHLILSCLNAISSSPSFVINCLTRESSSFCFVRKCSIISFCAANTLAVPAWMAVACCSSNSFCCCAIMLICVWLCAMMLRWLLPSC